MAVTVSFNYMLGIEDSLRMNDFLCIICKPGFGQQL